MEAWADKKALPRHITEDDCYNLCNKKIHAKHTGLFQKIANCKDF